MDLSARRRWRIQGVPLDFGRDGLAIVIRSHRDLQCPGSNASTGTCDNGAHVLTLASELKQWNRTQVATVLFEHLPACLETAHEKVLEFVVVDDHGGRNVVRLTIDDHFEDLTVLFSPSADATPSFPTDLKINVLFISGLACHPVGSFIQKSSGHLWLTDSLPKDRPLATVLTYGYNTKLVGSDSIAEIRHLGENLRAALRRLLRESPIPLVLVAHSLGGLVVKEALHLISSDMLDRVAAVSFFAVPHKGMHIKHLIPMVENQPNVNLVASLNRFNSHKLRTQQDEWKSTTQRAAFDISCFFELIKSPTAIKIDGVYRMEGPKEFLVDEESARSCFRDDSSQVSDRVNGVEKTHSDIVKFGPSESTYETFLEHLDETCKRLLEQAAGPKAQDSQAKDVQSHNPRLSMDDQRGTISKYERKKILDSLNFGARDDRYQTINLPHGQTCQWLLDSKEYENWLDGSKLDEHNGLLWIKGKPGSGKSTMMKFMVDHAPEHREVISFFFHARGEELEQTTTGMYRSLVWQLLRKLSNESLGAVLRAGRVCYDDLENATYKWRIPILQRLFQESVMHINQTLICYIDALDECNEEEVHDMVSFLEDLGSVAAEAGRSFRVCLASRPYPTILYEKAIELVLEHQAGHSHDIEMYIEKKLKIRQGAEDVRYRLREKANGVFMWVVLVTDILNTSCRGGRSDEFLAKLGEVPGKLQDVFRQIVELNKDDAERFLVCIQWTLWARERLRVEELYHAILVSTNAESVTAYSDVLARDNETAENFVLSASKGLVEVVSSSQWKSKKVQLVHESAREFFLKHHGFSNIWSTLISSSNLSGQGHQQLSLYCVEYINVCASKWNISLEPQSGDTYSRKRGWDGRSLDKKCSSEKSAKPGGRDVPPIWLTSNFPLVSYAVESVFYHANTAQAAGLDQIEFLKTFPCASWANLYSLIFEAPYYRYPPTSEASLLYILAYIDFDLDVTALIDCYSPENADGFKEENQLLCCPIGVAVQQQQVDTLRSMIQHHAQKNPALMPPLPLKLRWRPDGRILRHFEEGRQSGVLETLLQLEAYDVAFYVPGLFTNGDINAASSNRATLLALACEVGDAQATRVLLQHGANQSVPGPDGAFISAILCSFIHDDFHVEDLDRVSLTKVFLEHGQRVDSAWGEALINEAIKVGDQELFGFLIDKCSDVVGWRDEEGRTLLMGACRCGSRDSVTSLLDRSSDIHATDKGGRTALSWAAGQSTCRSELISILISSGARVDSPDYCGRTPLSWAASYQGSSNTAELLKHSARVDVRDKDGRTPVSWAAASDDIRHQFASVLEALLSHGAEVDSTDHTFRTPLSWAAGSGHRYHVDKLLEQHARVDSRDANGRTPLSWAASHELNGTIDLLIYKHADVDARDINGRTPISWAAEKGDPHNVSLLKRWAHCDLADNDGHTPAWWAETSLSGRGLTVILDILGRSTITTVPRWARGAHNTLNSSSSAGQEPIFRSFPPPDYVSQNLRPAPPPPIRIISTVPPSRSSEEIRELLLNANRLITREQFN